MWKFKKFGQKTSPTNENSQIGDVDETTNNQTPTLHPAKQLITERKTSINKVDILVILLHSSQRAARSNSYLVVEPT